MHKEKQQLENCKKFLGSNKNSNGVLWLVGEAIKELEDGNIGIAKNKLDGFLAKIEQLRTNFK